MRRILGTALVLLLAGPARADDGAATRLDRLDERIAVEGPRAGLLLTRAALRDRLGDDVGAAQDRGDAWVILGSARLSR